MGPRPDSAETVAKRREVLAELTTPKTKPELVNSLDISRSTVDRAVRALTEENLVERRESEYEATFAGREGLAAYGRFCDRMTALERAQPVLSSLPSTVDIDPAALESATVVESTASAPEAPIEENVGVVTSATSFRGTGPTVLPRYLDVLSTVLDGGTDVELVVTESVVEALSETYADGFEMLTGAAEVSLYVTAEPMQYAVWTAESPGGTNSGIVVYDETGVVGVINNDTEAMNEWAAAEYDRLKRTAQPLS